MEELRSDISLKSTVFFLLKHMLVQVVLGENLKSSESILILVSSGRIINQELHA
jgi:hypothetical protein